MSFNTLFFLFVFLPVSLVLCHIAPKRLKNAVLVVVSLVFYAWGAPEYLALMGFSLLFNWCAGVWMGNLRESRGDGAGRSVLVLTVAVNLLVLGFFKYWGFAVENLNRLFRLNIPYRPLPLPIGISFFTFSVLSYGIDVQRGKVAAQRNFISYAAYVTFFPKLVSGPIVTYADMEEPLKSRSVSVADFGEGAVLLCTGLFKKVLIADHLSTAFYAMTALPGDSVSVATAWMGMVFYSLILYFDFSGYSDMAIGIARMFGFRFEKNFDYPYMSVSITEFWRRWHISLGRWFRDYVYFPLGGSRVSAGRVLGNLLVVWLLTGIWHGSAWTFVIWGLIHGVCQILEKFLLADVLKKTPKFLRWLGTMLVVGVAWVFFFSPTLPDALMWVSRMLGIGAAGFLDGTARYYFAGNWPVLLAAVVGCFPAVKNTALNLVTGPGAWRKILGVAVYGGLLALTVAGLMNATYSSFLYFQF